MQPRQLQEEYDDDRRLRAPLYNCTPAFSDWPLRIVMRTAIPSLIFYAISLSVHADQGFERLYGIWNDSKFDKPAVTIDKQTIQVTGCKYRKYEILGFDESSSPYYTYYIEAEAPHLNRRCGATAPTFLSLSGEKAEDAKSPSYMMWFSECRNRADLERVMKTHGSFDGNFPCSILPGLSRASR